MTTPHAGALMPLMPRRVLVVAGDPELSAILGSAASRPDLELIPCPTPEAMAIAARAGRPDVVVIRLKLPGGDGMQICQSVRCNPEFADARVLMFLEEFEFRIRDDCFAAGCDDILYAPDDLAGLGELLAGAHDTAYRLAPRIPIKANATLTHAGGSAQMLTESLSHLAVRIPWREPPPTGVVKIVLELPLGKCAWWGNAVDPVTVKGKPEAILVRFLGLVPSERRALQKMMELRAGAATGALEASAPKVEGTPVPEAPVAPDSAPELPRRKRSKFQSAMLGLLAVVLLGAAGLATKGYYELLRPSRVYDRHAAFVVEGLPLKSLTPMRNSLMGITDASWSALSEDGKRRVLVALLARAKEQKLSRAEVYDSRGRAGVAVGGTAGSIQIFH